MYIKHIIGVVSGQNRVTERKRDRLGPRTLCCSVCTWQTSPPATDTKKLSGTKINCVHVQLGANDGHKIQKEGPEKPVAESQPECRPCNPSPGFIHTYIFMKENR